MRIVRHLSLALLLATTGIAQAQEKPVNFIHIIMDDLRSTGLPIYEKDAPVIAPNLERLASEGILFNNAHANFSSCGASRASLLTGLRPTAKRFTSYDSQLEKDAKGIITLPGYLKENGYTTLSLGKVIHVKGDTDFAWSEKPWDPKYDNDNTSSFMDYKDPKNIDAFNNSCKEQNICGYGEMGKAAAYERLDMPDEAYIDGKIANRAIAELDRLKNSNSPFYMVVGFVKPHLPFTAPKKYWDMYNRDDIVMSPAPNKPTDAPSQAWHDSGELRNGYAGIPVEPSPWVQNLPDELSRTLRHGYYASTTYSDAQVGKVLNAIKRLELTDNTVIILSSDHGFSLGDHTIWNKHSLFNLATQVPLIIKAPKKPIAKEVDGLVEYVDLYPTLVELAGLALPQHLEGKSLVSNLENPELPTKQAVFTRYKNGEKIVVEDYSYSVWFKKGKLSGHMLYDKNKDPNETNNLANQKSYSKLTKKLQTTLAEHIAMRDERESELQGK